MLKLLDYRTMKLLAEVNKADLSAWCAANGYLPHHSRGKTAWVVIDAARQDH